MNEESPFIVSADWLEGKLGEAGLAIVDASWYLPAHKRDAQAQYQAAHIPGAVFFDHDKIVKPGSNLPHTIPDPDLFARFAGSMGIGEKDRIVVYDGLGFFSAPRAWWMFKVMGAKNVFVLDGGFDRWKAEGRPVSGAPGEITPGVFQTNYDEKRVVSFDDMRKIVEDGLAQIADARPAGRFHGTDPEPRAGMRSGHMPGARNVPALSLSKDGYFLPVNELRAVFEQAGLDLSKPVVTSCGSGVTAAVISLALASIAHEDNRLYDGSWSEWGSRDDTPVVTGAE